MSERVRHRFVEVVAGVLVALLVLGVTGCTPSGTETTVTVSPDGARLQVDGATVVAPPGSAPAGSKLSMEREEWPLPVSELPKVLVPTASHGLKVEIDDGAVQPGSPLRLSAQLDAATLLKTADGAVVDAFVLVIVSDDGTVDTVAAHWDGDAQMVSGDLAHLSTGWFAQLDVGRVVSEVRDVVLQGVGLEFPRPACADSPATVGGAVYKPIQPSQAWVCVEAKGKGVRVRVQPNSALPFQVRSSPKASARQNAEVAAGSVFLAALFGAYPTPYVAPGVGVDLSYTGSPDITLGFTQDPSVQLLQILVKVAEVVTGPLDALDDLGDLECIAGAVEASTASVGPEQVAATAKAFFPCLAASAELSPAEQVLMGIFASGPQLLVAGVVGILNEVGGTGRFTADLIPTRPRNDPAGSAEGSQQTVGSTVDLPHFGVTVEKVSYSQGQGVQVLASVCVRKLPPDPQGDRTRISWDPWTVEQGGKTYGARLFDGSHPPMNMFPSQGTYRVGECAKGLITFADAAAGTVSLVRYNNSLGEKASWRPARTARPGTPQQRDSGTPPDSPSVGIDPVLATAEVGDCVAGQYMSLSTALAFPVRCSDQRAFWVVSAIGDCPPGEYENLAAPGGPNLCLRLNVEVGDCWELTSPPTVHRCTGPDDGGIRVVATTPARDQTCDGRIKSLRDKPDGWMVSPYDSDNLTICARFP